MHLRALFYCLLLAVTARAQEPMYGDEPRVFTGGLTLGCNFTQIDGDSYYGYHKIGVNIGGMVYIHFTDVFGVSMELLYSMKGSRGQTVTESPYIGTYVTKYYMDVNYIEVPLLLHLVNRNIDWEAGMSYALLVSSKEWILSDQPVALSFDKNGFRSSDIEWMVGFTKRLYKKLYANCRFQYSLTPIRDADKIPVGYKYGNNGQFNNMLTFRIVYAL